MPKPVLMVGGSLWLHWSRRHNSTWFIGNDHHKDSDFCSWHDTPIYEVNISQKRLSCTVVENPQKSLIKAKFWSHSFVIPILLSIIARKFKKNVRWDFFRFSNTVILVRNKKAEKSWKSRWIHNVSSTEDMKLMVPCLLITFARREEASENWKKSLFHFLNSQLKYIF